MDRHIVSRLLGWRPGKLAKGTLVMTAGMALRTAGQAAVFLIVARVLGVASYGAYVAVLALATGIGGLVGLGAPMIMLRDTARDPAISNEGWGRTLASWFVTSPPLFLIFMFVAWVVLPKQVDWVVVVCLGTAEIVLAPLILAAIQLYQGHERMGGAARLALVPILPRIVAALLLFPCSLIWLKPSALLMTWSFLYLLATTTAAGYSLWLVRRDFGVRNKILISGLRNSMRQGWAFAAGGAAHKIYVDVDKVMLARLASLEAAGIYSAAYRVVDMASVPLLSFFSAATPRFFRAGQDGTRQVVRFALSMLPIPTIYALVIGIALYMLAGMLPLILGKGFASAADALRWLVWVPLLTTLRYFLQNAFAASGRQQINVFVVVCGSLFNISLNLWAIQVWGWRGAIGATYAAEFAMCVGLAIMVSYVIKVPRSQSMGRNSRKNSILK